jgi:hypothetical protein
VAEDDRWPPLGVDDLREAQLHEATTLLPPRIAEKLKKWWLAPATGRAMSPSFDIAGTCTVGGTTTKGLLLVEAKAHDKELIAEATGRTIETSSSDARKAFTIRSEPRSKRLEWGWNARLPFLGGYRATPAIRCRIASPGCGSWPISTSRAC